MVIMKKVSNILYLIVGILSVVIVGLFVYLGISLLTNQGSILQEAYKLVQANQDMLPEEMRGATYEQFAQYVAPYMGIATGVTFGLAVPYLIVAVIGFIGGFGKFKKGGNVAGIIFGVLTADLVLLVAGILGLVAAKKAAQPQEPQVE